MPPQSPDALTPDKVLTDPHWQGLPREERRKVLQQVDPHYAGLAEAEQWKVVDQATSGQTSAPSSPMANAGFWESLRSTTPFAKADTPDLSQTEDLSTVPKRPPTIIEAGQQELEGMKSAAGAGDIAGAFKHAVGGALGPLGGGAMVQAGEQFGEGNIAGGLGTTVGLLAPLFLGESAARVSEARSARLAPSRMASVFGPTEHGTVQSLQRVGPEIDAAIKASGKDLRKITVEDLVGRPTATSTGAKPSGIMGDATSKLETEFQRDFAPIKNNPAPAYAYSRLRNNIMREISQHPNWNNTEDGRANVDAMLKVLREYHQPGWTLERMNLERSDLNTKMRSLSRAAPADRAAALKVDAELKASKIVSDVFGDVVNQEVGTHSGKGYDHYSTLRQKQSDLIDLRDALTDRFARLQDTQAAREGRPFSKKVRPHAYVNPATGRAGVHISGFTPEEGDLSSADTSLRKAVGGPRRAANWRKAGIAGVPISQVVSGIRQQGMTPPPGDDDSE